MDSVITRDPSVLGGLPVFRGTRVPVKNLFDCLEKGYAIKEFFGGLSRRVGATGPPVAKGGRE